jgi:hypothetical protein
VRIGYSDDGGSKCSPLGVEKLNRIGFSMGNRAKVETKQNKRYEDHWV